MGYKSVLILLLCWFGEIFSIGPRGHHEHHESFPHHGRCEPITIPLCMHLQYNQTIMPNLLNHQKQDDAGLEVHQYYPMENVNCSPRVKIFLCSLYAPVCTILDKPVPPCRSLCLEVRSGCENLLIGFGFKWPDSFDCEQFPDNDKDICFGENPTSSTPMTSIMEGTAGRRPSEDFHRGKSNSGRNFGFICPTNLTVPDAWEASIRVGGKVVPNCSFPCERMLFSPSDIQFIRNWVGVCSFLCIISCLFTVLTFAIDTERFKYPERPIIILAVCYLFVASAYMIGFFVGENVACRDAFSGPGDQQWHKRQRTIAQGTKHEPCSIIFMVLYFFSMASSIWWVVLTLTWFLAAGLKWGHEAIEANSQYFHMAAWGVPAIKTIALLAMGSVEGDVLSGVCYVGIWNSDVLRQFVLAPLVIYLLLGTIFLLAGYVSLFRIRTVMKHDGTKTDKLEKLMLRICVFSVLYMAPAITVIGCLFYEQLYMDQWLVTWHANICNEYRTPCPPLYRTVAFGPKPEFGVFLVKYLMGLIVGISSSVWVWSGKTVQSWTKFMHKIRGTRPQAYV